MVEQCCDRVGKALGRIPSGCAILTARTGKRRAALLASWIQQAGFDPPMISVAVKKGRTIEAVIDASGALVVNLLGEDPSAMFKHFGGGFRPDQDPFADLAVKDVAGGVAIDQRIAWLSARVHGKHDAGDHWLYLAEVTDANIDEINEPYVRVRKDGLSY